MYDVTIFYDLEDQDQYQYCRRGGISCNIYPCNLHIMVLALYRDCYWIPTSWIFLSNKSNLILFCDTYNGKYLHSRHFLFFPIFILSPAKIPVYIYQTLLLSRSTITNYTNPQDISTSSTSTLSFCHHHPQEI